MRKFIARFRQAPMFSSVYILGAALSVASVMLVAIFLHVKTSNIYPEYSRDRLLYNPKIMITTDTLQARFFIGGYNGSQDCIVSGYSPSFAQTIADSLKRIANVAVIRSSSSSPAESRWVNLSQNNLYVGDRRFENVTSINATPGIFNVYDYEFIEGVPFADDTAPVAAISDRIARRIFGTDKEVVGRKFRLIEISYGFHGSIGDDAKEFTVCGVFKEGSRLLPYSFAEVITPLNLSRENQALEERTTSELSSFLISLQGRYELIILPHTGVSPAEIKEVIDAQYAAQCRKPYIFSIWDTDNIFISISSTVFEPGQLKFSSGTYPRGSAQMMLGNPEDINEEFDFTGITKLYGVLILILLLVPALNLSSLISGNMDSKMSEMGIRKAFGARNSTLLRQVINENLWLTGCGAILGIILSWVGVLLWKEWLFAGVGENGAQLSTFDIMLDPAMLFAPKVFVVAIVVCVTLNLLSSLIPAWWALRRPAIDAIKAKS